VFENRVLRIIFAPKRVEKLHNVELHNSCSSPNIIRMIKSRRVIWVGYVTCLTEVRHAYTILVGKPEWNRLLGTPRHRLDDNIKMGTSGCLVNKELVLGGKFLDELRDY
jgi:hypothetical protein